MGRSPSEWEFTMKRRVFAGAVAVTLLWTAGACASTQLVVSSYDMPNGDGQAHGAWLNYWDATYSNCVADDCITDGLSGSYLRGGLGKLTNGIFATEPWYDVSTAAGTGQYVGWLSNDPTIVFNFAASVVVNEVKLTVDNSPVSVVVDGTSYASPASPTSSAPEVIDITGLQLTGDRVTVTLNNPDAWVFMNQAQFFTSAPEPSTWAMMVIGLGSLALARRLGSRKSAFAT